jgi:diguanylate cyclase (GGDEF)-like protein
MRHWTDLIAGLLIFLATVICGVSRDSLAQHPSPPSAIHGNPRLELRDPACLLPPHSAAAGRTNDSSSTAPSRWRTLEPWWRTVGFYAVLALVVTALTVGEWRWLIAREKQLRVLVRERTLELEAEKAELLRAKAALATLAIHDSLTGAYNRGAILELLDDEIKRAQRERSYFALVLTDLDHFKRINDTYGHLIGDDVLREFVRRVQRNLRPYDQVGRYGGEELLMIMPGMKEETARRIQALHRRISDDPFVMGSLSLTVTCCFGVAWFPAPVNTVQGLLGIADQALYIAKGKGRNRVEVASSSTFPEPERTAGSTR